jgi:quinol-cytochrome oxidoreductase complex cytochrome b subunit
LSGGAQNQSDIPASKSVTTRSVHATKVPLFMTNASTVLLVPFILAFLMFVLRFYSREGASGMTRPSFLLAILTVLIAGTYLALGITGSLPPYGTFGFAAVGVGLLGTAILRMFMI